MRAAIYARVSKDRTGAGEGVERQEAACRAFAAERGWEVARVYVDNDLSATNVRKPRPGYRALMAALAAGTYDAVIVWHPDRLHRRPVELEEYIAVCDPRGISTYATQSGKYDLSTPDGRMSARIVGAVARHEVEHKAKRQAAALEQKARNGEPSRTRRAFGYRTGGLEVDPREGPAVVEVFERFNAGASLASIRKWLNGQQLWTTGGKPWTSPAVRVLLRNPRYAGKRALRGEVVADGSWPALVDEDVWRAAVETLADPARKTHELGHARKWLGSNYYICGRCGATMHSAYRGLKGNLRRTYRCSENVGHLSRNAEPVDEYVEARLAERLRQPDVRALLAGDGPDLKPLRAERANLRARLKRFERDYRDGLIDGRQLKDATDAVTASLQRVQEALNARTRDRTLARLADAPDPGAAWLALADVAARQAVARALATVTLLPVPGRTGFDPASVTVEPT